ncbi:uncharacterized protein [Euphorbia lathyris]
MNTKTLAEGLNQIKGVKVDVVAIETNIVHSRVMESGIDFCGTEMGITSGSPTRYFFEARILNVFGSSIKHSLAKITQDELSICSLFAAFVLLHLVLHLFF